MQVLFQITLIVMKQLMKKNNKAKGGWDAGTYILPVSSVQSASSEARKKKQSVSFKLFQILQI